MRGHADTRPTRHDFERGRAPSARLAGERNAENQGEPTALVRHKLRRCPLTGSHLQLLALRYGVSVDAIRRFNEIEDGLPLSLHFACPLMSIARAGFLHCAQHSRGVHSQVRTVDMCMGMRVCLSHCMSLLTLLTNDPSHTGSLLTPGRNFLYIPPCEGKSLHPRIRRSEILRTGRVYVCADQHTHTHLCVCVCVCACVWVCFCSGCAFACLSNVSLCPNDAIQCRNYGARGPT